MLELSDVAVSYDGRPAVVDVSLALPDGEVLAVLGPSGCGKSTCCGPSPASNPPTPAGSRGTATTSPGSPRTSAASR